MKTKLLGWMTIALMAFVSVSLVSCGSDDDGDDNGGSNSSSSSSKNNPMVGTWYASWSTSDGTVGNETIEFKANGTGTMKGSNTYQGSTTRWNDSFTYTYTPSTGRVDMVIRYEDGYTNTETIYMSNNSFSYGDQVFRKR